MEGLLWSRHIAKLFMSIFSYNRHNNFMRYELPLAPFYRKWGSKSYWNLSKMTQLINRASGIIFRHSDSRTCALDHYTALCPKGAVRKGCCDGYWAIPNPVVWIMVHGRILVSYKGCSSPNSSPVPLVASWVAFRHFEGKLGESLCSGCNRQRKLCVGSRRPCCV